MNNTNYEALRSKIYNNLARGSRVWPVNIMKHYPVSVVYTNSQNPSTKTAKKLRQRTYQNTHAILAKKCA